MGLLLSKFCSGKILRNGPRTVFVIPQKKVLLMRNTLCLGKAYCQVRNGTEFAKKYFLNVIQVFFSVLEWFGTSFQQFFFTLIGSERNSKHFYLQHTAYVQNEIIKFWVFSLLQIGPERNTELFYLPRNGSEWRNESKFPAVTCFAE